MKDHRYYIGSTRDLERRIKEHNSGKTISLKHRLPLKLVYSESFKTRKEASVRERKIKSYKGGNSFKKLTWADSSVVECLHGMEEVRGSNPRRSTNKNN